MNLFDLARQLGDSITITPDQNGTNCSVQLGEIGGQQVWYPAIGQGETLPAALQALVEVFALASKDGCHLIRSGQGNKENLVSLRDNPIELGSHLKGATIFVVDEHRYSKREGNTVKREGVFVSRESVEAHLKTLGKVLGLDEEGHTVVHIEGEWEGMPYAYDAIYSINEEVLS
jgi:hypothetical protein